MFPSASLLLLQYLNKQCKCVLVAPTFFFLFFALFLTQSNLLNSQHVVFLWLFLPNYNNIIKIKLSKQAETATEKSLQFAQKNYSERESKPHFIHFIWPT